MYKQVAEMSVCGRLMLKVTIIPSIIPLLNIALLLMLENLQFILEKLFQEMEEMLNSRLGPAIPLRLVLTYSL
jgi:hypothetical protein